MYSKLTLLIGLVVISLPSFGESTAIILEAVPHRHAVGQSTSVILEAIQQRHSVGQSTAVILEAIPNRHSVDSKQTQVTETQVLDLNQK